MPTGKLQVNMRFAVLIYEGVEPIDLATFGVLSMARRIAPQISMFTVAPNAGEVRLVNGMRVIADHGLASAPAFDALIVTGGPGWTAQCADAATLDFIRRAARDRIVAGVCTGGMILAAAGVLDGMQATTKQEVAGTEVPPLELMRERHSGIDVMAKASLVDCGRVVTGDRSEHDRRVLDGASKRPDLIERGSIGDQSVPRD